MDRKEIAILINSKLQQNKETLKKQYSSDSKISFFYLDDLLPEKIANSAAENFPQTQEMQLKKSLKEDKYVSAQMDQHPSILEEILFAFQDKKVIETVSEITGLSNLEADPKLYAGGISRMEKNQFLQPHLDNSHDKDREKYRVLNLLYYISPNWSIENGGNLELWHNGIKNEPEEILSKFNRLVVMATDKHSLHSVNTVKSNEARLCISNYYFSKNSPEKEKYFHVTSFYGTKNLIQKTILKLDRTSRNLIRKSLPKNLFKNKHYYHKDNSKKED